MTDSTPTRPELFFGLVSPMGVGGGSVARALENALASLDYRLHGIKITDQLRRLRPTDKKHEGPAHIFNELESFKNEHDRYEKLIRAGDTFCQLLGPIDASEISDTDALTALAVNRIFEIRKALGSTGDHRGNALQPLPDTAYLFRSLKRPGEVDRLRRIYGEGFLLVSAYEPIKSRRASLKRKLASSALQFDPERAGPEAEKLIRRDQEEEGVPYGQSVRKTFNKADFFVDASRPRREVEAHLKRFAELLFGYQFHSPTVDEEGMAIAHLASLRSSHLSRQVGAALVSDRGDLISIGTNEVPRAFGGPYLAGDHDDARDFQIRRNTSLDIRTEVIGDAIGALAKLKWLTAEIERLFKQSQDDFLDRLRDYAPLMEARVMDALEFDRSVHAEMAALATASRLGVSVKNATLYCTTFPCHNCARHIIHAGIRRVVFIHPYEKSLTERLHGDAIVLDPGHTSNVSNATNDKVVFEAFLGVAPSLYTKLFTMGRRRGDGDRWKTIVRWDPSNAHPRLFDGNCNYLRSEHVAVNWVLESIKTKGLILRKEVQS